MKYLILLILICFIGCSGDGITTRGDTSTTDYIPFGEEIIIKRKDVTVTASIAMRYDGEHGATYAKVRYEIQNHTNRPLIVHIVIKDFDEQHKLLDTDYESYEIDPYDTESDGYFGNVIAFYTVEVRVEGYQNQSPVRG